MKKINNLLFLTLLFAFSNIFSQNTLFKSKKFELIFNQPEFFKNLKTFSYEIQDDGNYWNHEYKEDEKKPDNYLDYPNLQSLTNGLTIKGLKSVEKNGDIQIVVGFIGNQLEFVEKGVELRGTMNLMIIIDDNKLVHNETKRIQSIVTNSSMFPTKNRFYRNKTKAMILTSVVQSYIDSKIGVLFTGKTEIELFFGEFRKAKKGKAKEFNEVSKPLIEEIKKTKSIDIIDKSIAYWKKQLDIDYGKKLKQKRKLKVIYTNLATASIIKGDIEKATEYSRIAKKNSGFFDVFNKGYSDYAKRLKYVEENLKQKKHTITKDGRYVYEIEINEKGVFDLGNTKTEFSKIFIQRFVLISNPNSGVISLDEGESPTAKIFIDGKLKYIYNCNSKHSIKLENGKTIIFKLIKGEYIPYVTIDGVEEGKLF
ncbi:hypothetical protein RRF68_02215 [Tenacibaculum sp. HL-MS23]|uniref:hypothetical protein n=1 Tax=Tenacibaculum sp. HL-MS23 TaxID=3077734 RepID=UPI0028FC2082|nr:hypothetical protein [Tenacibaculum sp. HL-MS23]WNW02258.1 hypothetical protein RRF68_02215 [Tenacibaculum sp. HL-MS23]